MQGKIEAHGNWIVPLSGTEPQWNLNYSKILTQLIQDAGRYCESYASDLFIQWKYSIDNHLKERYWEGGKFRFGFREFGVDADDWIKDNESNPYYYRKIRTLEVNIDEDKGTIEMILS